MDRHTQGKAGESQPMRPIDPNDRRIANIRDVAFTPFVYPDGVALGDAILQLDDSVELGTGFHVYRMPPGMTTRGHRHNGHEQFLILEGELHESDGTILRAGDLVFYRDGTEHNSYTPTGCLLAVHIAGPEISVE
jgi:anti-sigma factor ChrR (cupin superfamily)